MCEIFCLNSKQPKQINQCLKCFYNHSEEHPDGWGLANMQSDKFIIDKQAEKASCSQHLKDILNNPLISKNVFAHIRLATKGEIISPNCHPFTQTDSNNRTWMLIHNGTVFNYPPLDKYEIKGEGNTDSERILLYIIDQVNQYEKQIKRPATIKERFNLLYDIISDMSKNNKLNLMIHDGDMTYIHSNMDETLHYLKKKDYFLVATTPVNNEKGWKKAELNKLFALKNGNIIYESKEHENEFKQTKEQEEYLNNCMQVINEN